MRRIGDVDVDEVGDDDGGGVDGDEDGNGGIRRGGDGISPSGSSSKDWQIICLALALAAKRRRGSGDESNSLTFLL